MGRIESSLSYFVRSVETKYFSHFLDKKRKLIVITGCGRSGTTYSSKVLKQIDIEIGHERLKKDGISSWYLASKKNKVVVGPSLNDLKRFDKLIIHQVREPLAAISSMLSSGSPSWKFLSTEIPIDIQQDTKILRSMKYYYYWNNQTEEIADVRIKAEEFSLVIQDVLERNNIKFTPSNIDLTKNSKINTRKHPKLTWDNLYRENEKLTEKIRILGAKYGY